MYFIPVFLTSGMSPGFESITLKALEEECDVLGVYLCCVSWDSLKSELQLNGNKKSIKSERKLWTALPTVILSRNHDLQTPQETCVIAGAFKTIDLVSSYPRCEVVVVFFP